MPTATLLAVVEVAPDERVRCSAESCGHSVYKRVHLVRVDGRTRVYGADCFARLFGQTEVGRSHPSYGGLQGRALTPEERELLELNTERLIEKFEREHQEELARAESRRSAAAKLDAERRSNYAPQGSLFGQAAPSAMSQSEAEAIARKRLAERHPGVNLDLPGFKGLVFLEIERVLRENAP